LTNTRRGGRVASLLEEEVAVVALVVALLNDSLGRARRPVIKGTRTKSNSKVSFAAR
jgi:hypothetical protein